MEKQELQTLRLWNPLFPKIYRKNEWGAMQNQTSNEVYVVSLGSGNPEDCWPKEPPNYIAFRYHGKLQSIHHIEGYVVMTNPHKEITEMPDKEWDTPYFIYDLGPAIIPSKVIKTGKIYSSGRVWCHLDALLTCDTISEARDLTKQRME